MEETVKNELLQKLEKIGEITLKHCRSDNEELRDLARSVNELAHEIYIQIEKRGPSSCKRTYQQ